MSHLPTPAALVAELLSLGVVAGHFLAGLPSIATLLAIVWYAINIHDRFRKKDDHE